MYYCLSTDAKAIICAVMCLRSDHVATTAVTKGSKLIVDLQLNT